MTRAWAAAAAASMLLVGAANAAASRTQLSIFQDDRALALSGSATRERTLDDVAALGADTIHAVVFWNKIAPQPLAIHRPDGFDGSDPAAYPAEQWDAYDGLVRGATVRGMELILSPASPLPAWASHCRGSRRLRKTCRPDLTQYKRFVQALGTRYSGEYPDENQGGGQLPRVSRWSVWNEPNQGGWLQPQYARVGGRLRAVSPVLYRGLVRAAIKGLRASGHGHDDILLGETAPLGRFTGPAASRPIPPAAFLRGVFCLDARGRALRGAAAAAMDCAGSFPRLAVTGVSHHPYTRGGSRPPTAHAAGNEITISSVSRLKRLLRQAAARGRLRRSLPIFYTEFGFQTDPPDRLFGVSLERQAAYLNQSDWMAFHDPGVRSVAQYELRDEAPLAAFQTGLRFGDGRAKPGLEAYRLPIWVTRAGTSRVRVWGQVRPASDDALEDVEVQRAATTGSAFETVKIVRTTNRKGFVLTTVRGSGGLWRLRWTPSDGGPTVVSRVAGVGR